MQRDLTSLQGKHDNLRADVDRLHFERIESLDRETVLNIKIQDLSNGHAYKKEIQGKKNTIIHIMIMDNIGDDLGRLMS